MIKESLNRFNIKYARKFLRITDLMHLKNEKLYDTYYQYVLSKLNYVLSMTWQEYCSLPNITNNSAENKYIWVMWWQGYDNAPDVIKNNINNLKQIFANKSVVIIDKNNYSKYTDISDVVQNAFNKKNISFTQWSDVVRYNLLKNHGGLWIDSSVMVSKAIQEIPSFLETRFISLVSKPSTSKFITKGQWTGWFIGGEAGFGLFVFLDLFFKNYYQIYKKTIDYFFADDAAVYYLNKDQELRKIIAKQAKRWNPYFFINNYDSLEIEPLVSKFRNDSCYCVQKITYKFDYDKAIKGSLADKIRRGELYD